MKVDVVGLNEYSFTDKSTGELKEGISVFMVYDDLGIDQGRAAGKFSLPLTRKADVAKGPGLYEADFGPKNKLMCLKAAG